MHGQVQRRIETREFAFPDCVSELLGLPADDDRREPVEPCDPEVPGSGRPVPDLPPASDPQRVFQRMVRLALDQAESGAQLDVDVVQPVDNEERASPPGPLPELATLAATAGKGLRPTLVVTVAGTECALRTVGMRMLPFPKDPGQGQPLLQELKERILDARGNVLEKRRGAGKRKPRFHEG